MKESRVYAEGYVDGLVRCQQLADATANGAKACAQQIGHNIDAIREKMGQSDDDGDEREWDMPDVTKPEVETLAHRARAGLHVASASHDVMWIVAGWERGKSISRTEASELAHLFGTFAETGNEPSYLYVPPGEEKRE
jgi:hypothetical protein